MNKTIEVLDALSEKTRMRIFLLLINGNLCVCELVDILDMKQARISRIMKKLNDAGLTASKRVGKRIIYSANPEVFRSSLIKGLLDDVQISVSDLKRLKKCKKTGVKENCRD